MVMRATRVEGGHSSWQAVFVHWPSCTIHEQNVIESHKPHRYWVISQDHHTQTAGASTSSLSIHTNQTVTLNTCTLLAHCSDNS